MLDGIHLTEYVRQLLPPTRRGPWAVVVAALFAPLDATLGAYWRWRADVRFHLATGAGRGVLEANANHIANLPACRIVDARLDRGYDFEVWLIESVHDDQATREAILAHIRRHKLLGKTFLVKRVPTLYPPGDYSSEFLGEYQQNP